MTKKQRIEDIKTIIKEKEIGTQEELALELNKKGYNVSQATASRDINDLNLIKIKGKNGKIKYSEPLQMFSQASSKIIDLFKTVTLSFESANNLIVIKTLSGNGSSVGMAIDQMHFPQILGTIAGDDTLLIVTKTNEDADFIIKSLRTL